LLVATIAALASVVLSLLFSEDWRILILGLVNRARAFVGSLTAKTLRPGG